MTWETLVLLYIYLCSGYKNIPGVRGKYSFKTFGGQPDILRSLQNMYIVLAFAKRQYEITHMTSPHPRNAIQVQYNTIEYNRIQYNAIQYNTMHISWLRQIVRPVL